MDCGVQSAMLSVPPVGDPSPQPPLTAASVFPPPDTDQAQFEADKRSVYKHPLFPLLALLFERCELATQSSDPQSSDAFNMDIQAFVQHQERDRKPFLANEPEIDGLMIKAIQVLRIHLLELEKVQELCKDFCNRYITCLKGKMQSENLLRSDYPQGPGTMGLENNNNSMMSHGNSESGSDSNSPVQYSISPSQSNIPLDNSTTNNTNRHLVDTTSLASSVSAAVTSLYNPSSYPSSTTPNPPNTLSSSQSHIPPPHSNNTTASVAALSSPLTSNNNTSSQGNNSELTAGMINSCVNGIGTGAGAGSGSSSGSSSGGMIVHGSTPLSQIGVNLCTTGVLGVGSGALIGAPPSDSSGPLSPAPTTPGGSADDCGGEEDSDFTSSRGGRKQKRGVLPKQATSVMRSWLFQHLVHPYPTEDEKRHIAAQTNLTLLQVNNWFINARRRILQPMLDASAPGSTLGGGGGGSTTVGDGGVLTTTSGNSPPSHKRKKSGGGGSGAGGGNNNRRFWPQDFGSMPDQLEGGLLSSSDEDGDSYSSDGDESNHLVIDSTANNHDNIPNGHNIDPLHFNGSPDSK